MISKSIASFLSVSLALCSCHLQKDKARDLSTVRDIQNQSLEDFSDLAYLANSQSSSTPECTGIFISRHLFLTAASCMKSLHQAVLIQGDHQYSAIRILENGNPLLRGGVKQTGLDLSILAIDDHDRESGTVLSDDDSLDEQQTSQTFIYDCVGDGQCPYLFAGLGRKKPNDPPGLHWRNLPFRSPFSRNGDEFYAGRFSFSICDGDFGSPIYRVKNGQKFLVGIASRYYTPAETNCLESDGAIYTNLLHPALKNRIANLLRNNP